MDFGKCLRILCVCVLVSVCLSAPEFSEPLTSKLALLACLTSVNGWDRTTCFLRFIIEKVNFFRRFAKTLLYSYVMVFAGLTSSSSLGSFWSRTPLFVLRVALIFSYSFGFSYIS
ncbi:conserved hypothetical protein, unlikely [Trypanosoma brucei gambiense DAL972]|nr:conserved hypothetical protein, unlikely [Trypanosoma brucei gambiense DAL972]CBH14379.1 conserved hypothetical protein, unlikely [Trypanosoma brucei gambiense DAL972]|eukprot:XP_011776645.1 conserved hypothetical protein, unlikely [Trypanosoma brucei gambiense DAL972]